MADNIEEASVCRICWDEVEEGNTIRLDCRCRGDSALAHIQCAVKWFAVKGDVICDICHHEVVNLRVVRIPTSTHRFMRVWQWQDEPVLLIVSILAYMSFLWLFMLNKMGIRATTISLPFGCIYGFIGFVTSTTMVRRRHAWIYATLQFVLVVCFAIIFRYSKLHLTGILSLSLATIAGFGSAICGSGLIYIFMNQHGETQDIEQPQPRPQEPSPQD